MYGRIRKIKNMYSNDSVSSSRVRKTINRSFICYSKKDSITSAKEIEDIDKLQEELERIKGENTKIANEIKGLQKINNKYFIS